MPPSVRLKDKTQKYNLKRRFSVLSFGVMVVIGFMPIYVSSAGEVATVK